MTGPQTQTSSRHVRRRTDAITAAVGLIVLVVGMIVVRNGTVSSFEEDVFHAVNDLPELLYPVLWPFQQLGAILVGPVVALVAALTRRYRLAIAAIIATVAKLVLERLVKAMVSRDRPGTSIGPDIHTRGAVSLTGESFVSGHAVLVGALAVIVAARLRGRWKIVPWLAFAVVLVTRVYVGAHNPLDVIAGGGLGLAIGGLLNLALGVPSFDRPTTPTEDSLDGATYDSVPPEDGC